jgi:plastocyanin
MLLKTFSRSFRKWLLPSFLVMAGLLVAFVPLPRATAQPTDRQFRLEMRSFEYSPPVIRVNLGDRVTLKLVSLDVTHGVYVDGYGLNVVAYPGQTVTLTFVADRPGTFRLRCSVTCGALHPFMLGELQVGANTLFWRGAGIAVLTLWGIFWLPRNQQFLLR